MTKLIAEGIPVGTRFKDLELGNIFELRGSFFLKLDAGIIYNAVHVYDGRLVYFDSNESVTIVREAILKY